ncbi:nucleoside triphosphate pyrophosphohydrolase [Pseudoflavonifractor phocaeensis]|uniref:nucleoside triphosphate pyrophosphohydrolase n=1 Tax=Pseudoflavonifractor phocaeensis TaxID=1870988 RepID=UPI00195835F2|nr:nucleoside triphosphate pyrophosphohydrolase [Pseudoflavonifractor phocaeensis]MBM6870061.1 nucleoside triphosphate pyrophosphohydrolase [Pseudoflavonifractor phocaeensis]MBM6939418.1 nucleoside triphosphate pyrophosphohydrolase [Pseudoflavonifractor phocaeensis]
MTDYPQKEIYDMGDLEAIVRILRAPGGCPWDAQQTHESIRRDFLEEVYEVAEAIDQKSVEHLKEELGDVLLQVLLHTRMEEEAGRFTLNDVTDGICRKLIYRHPHVFGDVTVSGTGEVLTNWEALKRKEKGQASTGDALDAVARSLPALWRAEKVQKKAAKVGFDWPDASGALDKVGEELTELRQAMAEGSNISEELGDLLFAVVNAARFAKCDPEVSLNAATDKFIARFRTVEALAKEQDKPMDAMSLAELDALWDQAKAAERRTSAQS